MTGKVYLVGAGPGDPELVTLKAVKLLKASDVIIYDRLANPEILEHAPPGAERIFVGKEARRHMVAQEKINELMAEKAKEGKVVVRLKGGDPFVFGRGCEELESLRRKGVKFEVVPGVTSALAVAEAACIPVTDRRVSSSFTIVTGHKAGESGLEVDFSRIEADTVVILMGLGNLEGIVSQLQKSRGDKTPIAVIQKGTTENEKVVVGTLENIIGKVKKEKVKPPTIIIVGEVVNLRNELVK